MIDLYLQQLMKSVESWTLSSCLKVCAIVKSKKVREDGQATHCFALHSSSTSLPPHLNGLTPAGFADHVHKFGGRKSQDAVLLDNQRDDNYVKKGDNGQNKKCLLIPQKLMSSETWTQICLRLEREDMLKLCDVDTPSGCYPLTPMQSTQTDELTSTCSRMTGLNISAIAPEQDAPDSGNASTGPTNALLTIERQSVTPPSSLDFSIVCENCHKEF